MPKIGVRALVVGVGSIGRRHAMNLRALGIENIAFCDPHEPQSLPLELSEAPWYSSLVKGLAWRPTVVLVTNPSSMHQETARMAVEQDCDVFIEKPVSHDSRGVDELIAEVGRRGLVAMVGCNMRFHPGPAMVKRLIGSGSIGSIIAARLYTGSYLPGWRPASDYRLSYSADVELGGGAMLDCIHEIDLALWYLGPATLHAAAVLPARTIDLKIEGLAELLLRHDTGALSSVHLNFVQRDYRRGCHVIGEQGTIYWDYSEPTVNIQRGDRVERHPLDTAWEVNQMYVDELKHFLDKVESRTAPTATIADGLAALRIVEKARAS